MDKRIERIREVLTSEDVVEQYGIDVIEQFDALLAKHKTFKDAVEPLMKWLCENQHPHTTVIVTGNRAELVEGLQCHVNDEFIVD